MLFLSLSGKWVIYTRSGEKKIKLAGGSWQLAICKELADRSLLRRDDAQLRLQRKRRGRPTKEGSTGFMIG
jgi:hypothetical protein